MKCYSIEPRARKYIKEYGLLSIVRNHSDKYGKIKLDNTKNRTICFEN